MHETQAGQYAYGLWGLVTINIGLFVGFLFSFAKPATKLEWRSLGLFSSFIVALFVEMYGFPLTIYLLSSWFGNSYPAANPFSHENGHLLGIFFGMRSDHGSILHLLSNILIFAGAIVIAQGWNAVHRGRGLVVTDGPYKYLRHPQYAGFIAIILGFLIQWPTLITVIMAPVLIIRYILLAKNEELYMLRHYPKEYGDYMKKVPAWFPKIIKKRGEKPMKKMFRILILTVFVAVSFKGSLYAEESKDMGMMDSKSGHSMMDGKMMAKHMMMKMMMDKSVVATSDGGVVIVAGNKLTKYDKDLKVVKEAEIKMDMEAMQKHMEEMMKKCPMMNKTEEKGSAATERAVPAGHEEHH